MFPGQQDGHHLDQHNRWITTEIYGIMLLVMKIIFVPSSCMASKLTTIVGRLEGMHQFVIYLTVAIFLLDVPIH
jgi:hypothetical protein